MMPATGGGHSGGSQECTSAAVLDEEQVRLLAMLADGRSLDEAAAALSYSRRTVIRRLAAVRRTLGVDTTVEALTRLDRHRETPSAD